MQVYISREHAERCAHNLSLRGRVSCVAEYEQVWKVCEVTDPQHRDELEDVPRFSCSPTFIGYCDIDGTITYDWLTHSSLRKAHDHVDHMNANIAIDPGQHHPNRYVREQHLAEHQRQVSRDIKMGRHPERVNYILNNGDCE